MVLHGLLVVEDLSRGKFSPGLPVSSGPEMRSFYEYVSQALELLGKRIRGCVTKPV
jgi:hypothetical protein